MSYTDDELPVEVDFQIPENHSFEYTPEELRKKMGQAAYEFAEANRRMRKLEVTKNIRVQKVRIILLAWRIDLLQNEKLKAHVKLLNEDPKYKWIKEDLNACVYIELEQILSEYTRYEKIAKQAEKEHAMWNSQMMEHMSMRKHEGLQNYDPQRTG